MKSTALLSRLPLHARAALFLAAALLGLFPAARAQIYVPNGGFIGSYNATTGAAINATLITIPGGSSPSDAAVSGSSLYIAETGFATVSVYNSTNGALINPSLLSGILFTAQVAVSGGDLYVSNGLGGTDIGLYTTAGVPIDPLLITGLPADVSFTVSGNSLYVSDFNSGNISEYDATTGDLINATLVTGLHFPARLAVAGGQIFVISVTDGTVGSYNATTGATINATLVSEGGGATDVAVTNGQLFVGFFNGTIGVYDPDTGTAINAELVSGLSALNYFAVSPDGEPAFTTQPANTTVTLGQPVTFTSNATGTPTPSYQWQISTDAGVTWTNITGGIFTGFNTANLTIPSTDAGLLGAQFRVLAINTVDIVVSLPATLGLNFPPTITSIPGNTFVPRGTPVTFTVGVSGTPPFTYQWQLNGRPIRAATGASLTLPKTISSMPATFSVTVSNPYGSVTSQTFAFQSLLPPTITKQPHSLSIRAGVTAVFVVGASGTRPLGIQWTFNGVNLVNSARIKGANTATLRIFKITPADAGNYQVILSNPLSTLPSSVVSLTVN
jgi:hypothetical protein